MLDLFSGIGGFALAAEWVWQEDLEIVGFCEIEPYCQKLLKQNFPGVKIYNDITKLDGKSLEGVDLITGGFPCQDISVAGKGVGIEGKSLARYDRNTQSLRTYQCSFIEDLNEFSAILPKAGLMRNGKLSEQTMLVQDTEENGFGLWRTPDTCAGGTMSPEMSDYVAENNLKRPSGQHHSLRLQDQVKNTKLWPTPRTGGGSRPNGKGGKVLNEEVLISEGLRERGKKLKEGFPTPQASDYIQKKTSKSWKAKGGVNYCLSNPEVFPTPNTMDHMDQRSEEALFRQATTTRKGRSNPSNLREFINPRAREIYQEANLPTPTSREWKGARDPETLKKKGRTPTNSLADTIRAETTGQLNPYWVEWLMGYPVGWTVLKD
jgi:hypothetical protein